MELSTIREKFLAFFESQGHTRVASSPLIPAQDPTLLFTNAGMVQFKDVFLGVEKRPYTRAVTVQRCLRAGGKHNDLENVGYTARHHTFFEMLGNFSFGDYFKKEAIAYAWTFLTEVLKLPADKLWVTVYEEDLETESIWLNDMKIDPTRFSRCGAASNFWAMGDTGPCGPCTEIFYDHGPSVAGGPPGSPDEDGDRYIEIWNLVFMQYNRTPDGKLESLPRPSVDTGMGLERIAAVMQHVYNNYDVDLFHALVKKGMQVLKVTDPSCKSLRVIADHVRSSSFLIVDGIRPSNEGRGYVLRRIIRRAVRHGHLLGAREPFLSALVPVLVEQMSAVYPALREQNEIIQAILQQEEMQFARTLTQGMRILEDCIAALKNTVIPGDVVFKLYDTYGFPVDLTQDIARERGLTVEMAEFEKAMQAQKERSTATSQFTAEYSAINGENQFTTDFAGYTGLEATGKVLQILVDGASVESLKAGQAGAVILDKTPFYAASGGQVGDIGVLTTKNTKFTVKDTTRQHKAHVHWGILEKGEIRVGEMLEAQVDSKTRMAVMLNHSATHLLHAALRHVLGQHVVQKGSLVAADKLRFDFAHTQAMTAEELERVQMLVNQKIREDLPSHLEVMDMEKAIASGAMALFGEKYDEKVRVLEMAGGFSKELCGGTHVERVGQIGFFKITQEMGIAAGIRRIEAVTGQTAIDYVTTQEREWDGIAQLLKADRKNIAEKIQQLLEKQRMLERECANLHQQLMQTQVSQALDQAIDLGRNAKMIITQVQGQDAKQLRQTIDLWRDKIQTGVVVLAQPVDEKVSLMVGTTPDCKDRLPAGELVKFLAQQLQGQGGGRPDLAQGGGLMQENLETILHSAVDWAKSRWEA